MALTFSLELFSCIFFLLANHLHSQIIMLHIFYLPPTAFRPPVPHPKHTFRKCSKSRKTQKPICPQSWNKKWPRTALRSRRRPEGSEACSHRSDPSRSRADASGAMKRTRWMKRWLQKLFRHRPNSLWAPHSGRRIEKVSLNNCISSFQCSFL